VAEASTLEDFGILARAGRERCVLHLKTPQIDWVSILTLSGLLLSGRYLACFRASCKASNLETRTPLQKSIKTASMASGVAVGRRTEVRALSWPFFQLLKKISFAFELWVVFVVQI